MTKNQCDGCQAGVPVDRNGNHRMGGKNGYPDLMGCQKFRYEQAGVEEVADRLVRLVREGQITSQDAALDFIYDEATGSGVSVAKVEAYLENRDDLDFNLWGEYCDRHHTLHDCRGEDDE